MTQQTNWEAPPKRYPSLKIEKVGLIYAARATEDIYEFYLESIKRQIYPLIDKDGKAYLNRYRMQYHGEEAPLLVLDLTSPQFRYIYSAFVGVMINFNNTAQQNGGDFAVSFQSNSNLMATLTMLGIGRIIKMYDSRDKAVHSLEEVLAAASH